MSFTGFKKQISKANQYVSEKIGGAEPTKPTEEFIDLERKTDLTNELVEELIVKTKEMMFPNPALRAKIAISSKVNARNEKYPHPEGEIGETMVKYGSQFGKETDLGQSLIKMGLTLKETTEIKYSLEETIKKKFLEPLNRLQLREIKDCLHHRKKLEGRRLDYDCKKRKKLKGVNVFETDLKTAENKYMESLKLTTVTMQHLIHNDKQQVYKLISLSEALYEYHSQCANIFQTLTTGLKRKTEPKKDSDLSQKLNQMWTSAVDNSTATIDQYKGVSGLITLNRKLNNSMSNGMSSATNVVRNQSKSLANPQNLINESKNGCPQHLIPKCRAIYDFEAENDNELTIKEGNIIRLIDKVDDQWFEGSLNGRVGLFPINYVEVIVPLSH